MKAPRRRQRPSRTQEHAHGPERLRTRNTAARYLAAIVESSEDVIVSKTLQGIITSWNRTAERVFGYTADEVIGKSIRIIIPADRQSEEDEVLRRIGRGEVVEHYETIRQRKDGTLVPVSLTVSPVRGVGGRIIGASKIARDISERKRTEAALNAARTAQADLAERLQALVAASGWLLASPRSENVLSALLTLADGLLAADGYAVWRLNAGSGMWEVSACHGVSAAFALRLISPNSQPPVAALEEPLVAEDVQSVPALESRRETYREEGIVSLLAVPLRIAGQISGTFVFYYRQPHRFSDVERQTASAFGNMASAGLTTAELHEEQRRQHNQSAFLAEASAVLGASLDYRETLTRVARLATPQIADWCAVDLVNDQGHIERLVTAQVEPNGASLAELFPEQSSNGVEMLYDASSVIRTGAPSMHTHLLDEPLADEDAAAIALRALGCTSYISVPLVARSRTIGALTFLMTASGRHYAPADLQFAENVAGRAALAIENARAYEAGRQANQFKDEFLATLSHELRTPLNAIVGYSRMLEAGVIASEKRSAVFSVLNRNATALTQIVEDVLDISRIATGKVRLDVQPVDVAEVVSDAIATIRLAAEAKGLAIQAAIDRRAGLVSGDADRLRQVAWNLLSNAVKFTPRGGAVQVHVQRVGPQIELAVCDTGIGIPSSFLPHLFERFRQADGRFSREHGGLGLGLAIAQQLVEMHGGTITAASDGPGTGATFRVRLPLMIAARQVNVGVPMLRQPAPQGMAVELSGERLDGLQIVAVDDEEDSLALLRDILEAAGATVLTVRAPTALETLERVRPDVFITDIGMPGIDGFDLLAQVRQSDIVEVSHVPAAALTGYARSDDRLRALRAGFQIHLAKPIDPAELIAAVRALAQPRLST